MEASRVRRWSGRPVDPVGWYLDRIGQMPLATSDEEVELVRDMEAGLYAAHKLDTHQAATAQERADLATVARRGQVAKARLIEANLRLVTTVAKRYQGRGMALADLIQEGNLGLIHAVEKFDDRTEARFSTYAGWWIRQAITRALAERGRGIRVPQRQAARIDACTDADQRLSAELGRNPTPDEIGAATGLPAHRVTALQRVAIETRQLISLHAPINDTDHDEQAHELGELIEDTDAATPGEQAGAHLACDQLETILDSLPDNYRRIVAARYGLADGRCRELADIGAELGITGERVRQLLTKAITRLRQHPQAHLLAAYPDL